MLDGAGLAATVLEHDQIFVRVIAGSGLAIGETDQPGLGTDRGAGVDLCGVASGHSPVAPYDFALNFSAIAGCGTLLRRGLGGGGRLALAGLAVCSLAGPCCLLTSIADRPRVASERPCSADDKGEEESCDQ